MIAQGGDPEAMTVSQYLDLAYATLVDDRVRKGASIFDALEGTRELAARTGAYTIAPTASGNTYQPSDPPPSNVEAQNEQALQQFMAGLGGLGGLVR